MSGGRLIHITNGDSTAERIQQTGAPGPIVVWRDMLHSGPVPGGLSLEELSRVRSEHIAAVTGAASDEVLAQFRDRDHQLAEAIEYSQIVLWFEHDLYDQLQLIQILDWLGSHGGAELPVYLICIGSYPGIARFTGLGQLTPAQLRPLVERRRKVKPQEYALASTAWAAFTSPDPKALESLARGTTSALPFLRPALVRHLEDFPQLNGGLSRTEKQLLEVIRDGMKGPYEIFIASQERETVPFLGDASVWSILRELSSGATPLLVCNGGAFVPPAVGRPDDTFLRQSLTLTDLGREVVAGRTDWIALRGIDRWLGGVHLAGDTAAWRWDERRARLLGS